MAAEQQEVEMTVDTFNLDMGGRLRAGHVYKMNEEHADHLKARGYAKNPTKSARDRTAQTQEEEIAELRSRLERLTGDNNFGNIVTEGSVSTLQHPEPPAPEPPAPEGPPVVMTSSTRRSRGIPDLEADEETKEEDKR